MAARSKLYYTELHRENHRVSRRNANCKLRQALNTCFTKSRKGREEYTWNFVLSSAGERKVRIMPLVPAGRPPSCPWCPCIPLRTSAPSSAQLREITFSVAGYYTALHRENHGVSRRNANYRLSQSPDRRILSVFAPHGNVFNKGAPNLDLTGSP